MDPTPGTDGAPLRDLDRLLASLDPDLDPDLLAYAALPPAAGVPAGLEPVFPCRRIVLRVRSALEAVGLTAAVATALADAGIPCNVLAALHHDHLLVPAERAEEALARLRALAAGA